MATSTRIAPDIGSVPLLVDGDRLSRDEFERRYDAMPDLKKAELIDGVVYMGSPVWYDHGLPHARLIQWIGYYELGTPNLLVCDNTSVRLGADSMPQPDIALMIPPESGGLTRVGARRPVEGSPELVLEVAYSNLEYDSREKLEVYRHHGVKEYVLWRVEDGVFDWFVLRDGMYHRVNPSADGLLESEVFPGLWLDPEALIRNDLPAVFRAVQLGLATPEHAAFVAELSSSGDRT